MGISGPRTLCLFLLAIGLVTTRFCPEGRGHWRETASEFQEGTHNGAFLDPTRRLAGANLHAAHHSRITRQPHTAGRANPCFLAGTSIRLPLPEQSYGVKGLGQYLTRHRRKGTNTNLDGTHVLSRSPFSSSEKPCPVVGVLEGAPPARTPLPALPCSVPSHTGRTAWMASASPSQALCFGEPAAVGLSRVRQPHSPSCEWLFHLHFPRLLGKRKLLWSTLSLMQAWV